MDRDLLVQALIVVVIANTLVIGLALAGGRRGGFRARAEPPQARRPAAVGSMPAATTPPPSATTPAVLGRTTVGAPTGVIEGVATTQPPGAAAPLAPAPGAATRSAAATRAVATGALIPPSSPSDAAPDAAVPPGPSSPDAAASLLGPWDRFADLVQLEGPVGWSAALERERHRLLRSGTPVAIVALEAHGYGAIEERFGPVAGRAVAGSLARTVRELSRSADIVACLGPGAFRMLLLGTDRTGAIRYVERLAAAADPWLGAGGLAVRLAAGVAAVPDETDLGDAVRLAEQRMHEDGRRPVIAA